MPTPTDLVTDLPADFEVFGQAVDTSLADLLGGTTGQVLSKTSNTDMDFTWTNANPGDITGVTAGTGISGGGTSGDVTVTNSMATAIDAKGDLIVGTGADTFSKLSAGTNGYLLTADSAEATGLKWSAAASSGGMTLISSTALGTGSSITLSDIPQTYKNLQVVFRDLKTTGGNADLRMTINGSASSGAWTVGVRGGGALAAVTYLGTQGYIIVAPSIQSDNFNQSAVVNIYDYANADSSITFDVRSIYNWDGSNYAGFTGGGGGGRYDFPCTSLVISHSTGNLNNGTVLLYGVK